MAGERWETEEELRAAWRRFAAEVPGYEAPAAYGVGVVGRAGGVTFPHVNRGDHQLPAVVLANVCGYRSGTRVCRLTGEQLDRAIELLAPAEASTLYEHPNLWSWREMRANAAPDARYVAVFVRRLDDPVVDARDAAFRQALAGRSA